MFAVELVLKIMTAKATIAEYNTVFNARVSPSPNYVGFSRNKWPNHVINK